MTCLTSMEGLEVNISLLCRGREGAFNTDAYYQPSMLEDPWKQLRKQKQLLPPPADAAQAGSMGKSSVDSDDNILHSKGAADRP